MTELEALTAIAEHLREIVREIEQLALTGNSTAESFSRIPQIWDGKRTVKDVALQAQKKRKPRVKRKRNK